MDKWLCDGCMAISGLTNGNSCIKNMERMKKKRGDKKVVVVARAVDLKVNMQSKG